MQRGIVVLGLAVSLVAIVVSVYAVMVMRTDTSGPDVHSSDLRAVERVLAKLEERVAELESGRDAAASLPPQTSPARRPIGNAAPSSGEAAKSVELARRVEELTSRLSELEDVETMAKRVRVGEKLLAVEKVRNARLDVLNRSLSPEARLEAMEHLDRLARRSDEIVAAMRELALDPNVDTHLRCRAIESLGGLRDENVKHDMLELLANAESTDLRGSAMYALWSHADDPRVVEAVRRISEYDHDAQMQSSATDFIGKLEWLANEDGKLPK